MPSTARTIARRLLPHRVRQTLRDRVAPRLGLGAAGDPAPAPAAPPAPPRPAALVQEVRDLLTAGDLRAATARAAALSADRTTQTAGAIATALVASRRGARELAWQQFRTAPLKARFRLAPTEYLNAGVVVDPDTVTAEVAELVELRPDWLRPQSWARIWEVTFGAGHTELADRVFAVLDEQVRDREVGRNVATRHEWAARWVGRPTEADAARRPETVASFAIVDYDHPGRFRASCNIGDHVQTLASLGHLVRHQDLRFAGDDADLVALLETLQGRTRPERRRHGVDGTVQVQTVARDATAYDAIPPGTWVLAFGWYMHALAPDRYGLPLHRNLQPVFVSFHCNQRQLLTPEVVEYLREHGPIGCRDWTTVDILLSLDVPAFFSGCMTTTVSTVFPDEPGSFPADRPVAYVDMKPADVPEGAVSYRQGYDAVRLTSFPDNVRDAVSLLETYRRDHASLVTSRLHCYLPMRSLGATVDFRPKNLSDIRFAGLNPLTDEGFDAIREGICDKLETLFGAILAGRSAEEVYATWREITADDVAAARARFARPADDTGPVELEVAPVGGAEPDAVHVAVPGPGSVPLAVLQRTLSTLVASASQPVHAWLLDERGFDPARLPEQLGLTVSVVSLPATGEAGTAERLAVTRLGALLPEVSRVVVLPPGAVLRADVAELAGLELGGEAFAAPSVPTSHDSGFGLLHTAGNRLGADYPISTELRRQAHARHAFDFTAFETDVMVVDLDRWREDDVALRVTGLARDFGLTPREALHFLAGPHRAELPRRWHLVPTRMPAGDAALVHYEDPPYPWQGVPALGADLYESAPG